MYDRCTIKRHYYTAVPIYTLTERPLRYIPGNTETVMRSIVCLLQLHTISRALLLFATRR